MKSQLRQDLVSGDWIVISPGRAKRPEQLAKKGEITKPTPKTGCPFEKLPDHSGKPAILTYGTGKDWRVMIFENKYPAFFHAKKCDKALKHGPYSVVSGTGHHEIVATHDHYKNFPALSLSDSRQVFESFRDRYLMLLDDPCIEYISIFHNWGKKAGASIYHPHYQIIAIPVIPPDVSHSLTGSLRYYRKHKKCVHCTMMDWELKNKTRVIYENDGALVFMPFVSKEPFEMRIFPKKHLPYFENTLDTDLDYIVDALRFALRQLETKLHRPDYNFFIHTAPLKNKEGYKHYHWHIEIVPKFNISAGFELGTGIEINPVDPDDAAKILRK